MIYALIYKTKLTIKDMCSCFVPSNLNQDWNIKTIIDSLKNKAVIKIQTFVRMKIAQRIVKKIRVL